MLAASAEQQPKPSSAGRAHQSMTLGCTAIKPKLRQSHGATQCRGTCIVSPSPIFKVFNNNSELIDASKDPVRAPSLPARLELMTLKEFVHRQVGRCTCTLCYSTLPDQICSYRMQNATNALHVLAAEHHSKQAHSGQLSELVCVERHSIHASTSSVSVTEEVQMTFNTCNAHPPSCNMLSLP